MCAQQLLGRWVVAAAATNIQVMALSPASGEADTPGKLDVKSVGILPPEACAVSLSCTGSTVAVGMFPSDVHVFSFDSVAEKLRPILVAVRVRRCTAYCTPGPM